MFQIPVPASTPANELKSVHKFVIQNGKTRVTSQVTEAVLSNVNFEPKFILIC